MARRCTLRLHSRRRDSEPVVSKLKSPVFIAHEVSGFGLVLGVWLWCWVLGSGESVANPASQEVGVLDWGRGQPAGVPEIRSECVFCLSPVFPRSISRGDRPGTTIVNRIDL